MSWPLVPLGETAKFIRGITFKPTDVVKPHTEGSVVCMRTKNVQAVLDERDLLAIPQSFVKRREQMLQNGDLLVSSANSWNLVGKCCWIENLSYSATAGGFISILRANEAVVFPRFLYHWFSSRDVQDLVRNCGRQTTNISNLDFVQCLALEIPLPPLPEQQRIAAILDKSDALRHKRRDALSHLDRLLQSVFVEMFGDPVTNPKEWPSIRLDAVGSLDRGKSKHRPRNDPRLYGGSYPFIQTGDVANSKGYINTHTQTYSELGLKQSKMWKAGTLCITIAANIAKTAILEIDACFPDSIVGFSPYEITNVEYVKQWLSNIQKDIEDAAPESAQKNINLEILKRLMIPLPPLDSQQKFAAVVEQVESLRARQLAAQTEADALFAALQARAFAGEL